MLGLLTVNLGAKVMAEDTSCNDGCASWQSLCAFYGRCCERASLCSSETLLFSESAFVRLMPR